MTNGPKNYQILIKFEIFLVLADHMTNNVFLYFDALILTIYMYIGTNISVYMVF